MRSSNHLPVSARTSGTSIALFLGWTVLAWAVCSAVGIFVWIPQWKEFPNPFAAFAGSCVILWGTRSVLRRDGHTLAALGNDLRARYLPAIGSALLIGAGTVVIATAVLAFFLRPQWGWGTASWSYALGVLVAYSVASFLEELMFRGYLLRRLTELCGRGWALAAIALAFGLFHLPGLAGLDAVKMVCTTAACSLLFSALTLRSGTLWSAVAAHLAMNWVLHTVLGVTGKTAFFRPVFDTTISTPIDVGFWSFLLVVGGSGFLLLPKTEGKMASGELLRSAM
jgi:membrane protease YdiL (CAAX protease family)